MLHFAVGNGKRIRIVCNQQCMRDICKALKALLVAVLVIFAFSRNANSASIKGKSQKTGYDVCGFRFASIGNFSLTKRVISEDSLRNRIANERFNACQYKVFVSYLGIPFELGFGDDVTMESIEQSENFTDIDVGVFHYDENHWTGPTYRPEVHAYKISVRNTSEGIVLSGLFMRKYEISKNPEFCFGMSAIGKKRFLTTWVCRPTKKELIPLEELFRKNVVISFNQN